VVAVGGIGVGTWVLGSGPDSPAGTDGSASTSDSGFSASVPDAASSPEAPVVSRPPLSVAPVPSAERDDITRATRKARAKH
jgi:hypothetical protein